MAGGDPAFVALLNRRASHILSTVLEAKAAWLPQSGIPAALQIAPVAPVPHGRPTPYGSAALRQAQGAGKAQRLPPKPSGLDGPPAAH